MKPLSTLMNEKISEMLNITPWYVSVPGVSLYYGDCVLDPEVDGGGGGLVVVVLGGAALVLPPVLQAGQSKP